MATFIGLDSTLLNAGYVKEIKCNEEQCIIVIANTEPGYGRDKEQSCFKGSLCYDKLKEATTIGVGSARTVHGGNILY